MLDLKADPHAANKTGSTALISAAKYDRVREQWQPTRFDESGSTQAAVITALLTWEIPEEQQLVTSPVQPAMPAPVQQIYGALTAADMWHCVAERLVRARHGR